MRKQKMMEQEEVRKMNIQMSDFEKEETAKMNGEIG
jgi:hypothetical protein